MEYNLHENDPSTYPIEENDMSKEIKLANNYVVGFNVEVVAVVPEWVPDTQFEDYSVKTLVRRYRGYKPAEVDVRITSPVRDETGAAFTVSYVARVEGPEAAVLSIKSKTLKTLSQKLNSWKDSLSQLTTTWR